MRVNSASPKKDDALQDWNYMDMNTNEHEDMCEIEIKKPKEKHIPPEIINTKTVRDNIDYIRKLSEDYNIPIQDVAEIANTFDGYGVHDCLSVELDNYYSCYY